MDNLPPGVLVDDAFLAPALTLLNDYCRTRREAQGLSDEQFVRLGILRVFGRCDSGRDFLQGQADMGQPLARSTWFDALQSNRRLELINELGGRSYEIFRRLLQDRDWLDAFPELEGRAVWAVDGHQIEHASHAALDTKGERVPVGTLYGLCLHTGLMRPLAPFQGDGVRRHEWPVFKKHFARWLRQDGGKLMPIVVADPAYIDVLFWAQQRLQRQAVMITREKENMKPTVISSNPFDSTDPVNRGVEADGLAGYTYAYLRRIVYCDPTSGERLVFITTEQSLRPGVIALLYLLRWKIEKAYDVSKNKLHQQKAWANGENANLIQAHFCALAHNLLTLFMATLEKEGLSETKLIKKETQRLHARPDSMRLPAQEMIHHAAQLSCQFIRLVRHCLFHKTSWQVAFPLFRSRLESYL